MVACSGGLVDAATVRWLLRTAHTPQAMCHAAAGCTACPDARTWPQTKFLVKRVADDAADRSGVRRLLASLPGVRASAGAAKRNSSSAGVGARLNTGTAPPQTNR